MPADTVMEAPLMAPHRDSTMSAANYPVFILAFFITGFLAAVAALKVSPRMKSLAYQVLCGSCIGVIVSVVLLVWFALRPLLGGVNPIR
jgi:hypothetical protein